MRFKRLILTALAMPLVLLLSLSAPVSAAETIRVKIVAKTQSGNTVSVPNALCQITVGEDVSERWTDAQGIITIPAVTGKLSISPIALPAGYKFLEDEIPVLVIEGDEAVSIPSEDEKPPQIIVGTSLRVPSLTVYVKDSEGKEIQGAEITVTTLKASFSEKMTTDKNGVGVMTIGYGIYRVTVTGSADGDYQPLQKQKVFLGSDETLEVTLEKIEPVTTLPESETTEPTEPMTIVTTSPPTVEAVTETTESSLVSTSDESEKGGSSSALQVLSLIVSLVSLGGIAYLVLVNVNLRKGY